MAAFRFRLRTALVLMATIALVCALFGEHFRRQRLLKKATAAFQSERAMVAGDMYSVILANRADANDVLNRLDRVARACGGARFMILNGSHVDDNGLVHLQGWRRLQDISLSGTCVNDEGLANLAELSQLQKVRLRDTRITDAGLATLCAIPSLEFIDVSFTDVTRQGVETARQEHPRIEIESSFDDE